MLVTAIRSVSNNSMKRYFKRFSRMLLRAKLVVPHYQSKLWLNEIHPSEAEPEWDAMQLIICNRMKSLSEYLHHEKANNISIWIIIYYQVRMLT